MISLSSFQDCQLVGLIINSNIKLFKEWLQKFLSQ